MQLHQAGAGLLVGVEVALELVAEVGLPESDVPAPADPAVTDVGAAEILEPVE